VTRWWIYYGAREYAKERDDPCLGYVYAETKAGAEAKAAAGDWQVRTHHPIVAGAGFWAVEG